jgi:flagellar basal body P-ring formation protein FlgA
MNRLRNFACLWLLGLAAGSHAQVADTPALGSLQLRPTVQVDGNGVFLHQLIQSGESVPANLRLAPAPAPGQNLELSRAQIVDAAHKLDSTLSLTNWNGADKVKISRRSRLLEEAELKDLLTATLQREKVRDRGELELHLGRPWTAINIPDEPFTVRTLEMPLTGVTPNFILRFELRTERESFGFWQVPLQARVWHDVWVARAPQPRGRLLHEADLTTERRDLLTLRDPIINPEFNDPSLELTENLPSGAPLLAHTLRPRPVVQRGRLVDAVVQDGSLLITLKAEALEDGLPGQMIRVRNANSKREFRGKVQNEQTVIVPL